MTDAISPWFPHARPARVSTLNPQPTVTLPLAVVQTAVRLIDDLSDFNEWPGDPAILAVRLHQAHRALANAVADALLAAKLASA